MCHCQHTLPLPFSVTGGKGFTLSQIERVELPRR